MPIQAVTTWDSAEMIASVMPSTREFGGGLRAAARGRAQTERRAGPRPDPPPDRHAKALHVEMDERFRVGRQPMAQERTAAPPTPVPAPSASGTARGARPPPFLAVPPAHPSRCLSATPCPARDT